MRVCRRLARPVINTSLTCLRLACLLSGLELFLAWLKCRALCTDIRNALGQETRIVLAQDGQGEELTLEYYSHSAIVIARGSPCSHGDGHKIRPS
ncbi:hypothetical protein MHYP_G00114160 [Metynnis hypsauchen]